MFSKRVTMILASLGCLSSVQAQTIAQGFNTRPIVKLEIPRTTVVQRPENIKTQLPTINPSTGTTPTSGAGSISDRLRVGRGGMDGGGGNAVVCRDNEGRVTRAKLLDLFEGEALEDLVPQKFDESLSFEEIAKLVAKNIDRGGSGNSHSCTSTTSSGGVVIERTVQIGPLLSSESTTNWVEYVLKNYKVLPAEVGLEPIADSGHFIFPRDCKIEQVAVYRDDSNRIFFVNDIWMALDKVHKAALIVHEALYKNLRSPKEMNSDRTRKAVAHAFSGFEFKPLLDGIPEGNMIVCTSNDEDQKHRFVLRRHPQSKNHALLHFVLFDGFVPLSKLTQFLPISYTPLSPSSEENSSNIIAFDMKENFLNPNQSFNWKIKLEGGRFQYFLAAPKSNSSTEEDYSEITCRNGGFEMLPGGGRRTW